MKSTNRRGAKSLVRKRGTRSERLKVLIVTEGTKTEPQYFDGLCFHLKATATTPVFGVTTIGSGRDPMRIVKEAERRRREEQRKGDPFDQVWCVIDVDNRDLSAAVGLAKKLRISCAVSNPCFEVWILWHFEDCTAECNQDRLKKRLRPHGVVDKNLPNGFPFGRYIEAVARADKCAAQTDGRYPNPFSAVGKLVLAISRGGR